MTSDQDIIQEAYADAMKDLFAVFVQSSTLATNDQERALAEQRFQAGVRATRAMRDRATILLS